MAEERQALLPAQAARPEGAAGYRAIAPEGGKAAPLVFCIHGNKWGVASCCDDLEENHAHPGEAAGPEIGYQAGGRFLRNGSDTSQHCHQAREEGVDRKAQRKLITATVLCTFFMIVEIVGGVLSNSLAIATDAAHLLTDLASFMISLFAIRMAAKPRSQKMSFGWHRAEVLGATVSVLMIWLVTGILVYMAVLRVINQEFEIDATMMLITSGVGVAVNIVMGATLHQHGHSHGGGGGGHGGGGGEGGHGHAHGEGEQGHSHGQEEVEQGHAHAEADTENINVRAAFIHVIGDFLQSLGVFVAAIVIYFKPEWNLIDPICTFVFSILVLFTTIKILKDTLGVLLEATPEGINYDIVKNTFLSVKGIRQCHSLRIWALTTDKAALAAHLAIDKGLNAQEVLQAATVKIRARYNFYEMTLQVEEYQPDMSACDQCKDI